MIFLCFFSDYIFWTVSNLKYDIFFGNIIFTSQLQSQENRFKKFIIQNVKQFTDVSLFRQRGPKEISFHSGVPTNGREMLLNTTPWLGKGKLLPQRLCRSGLGSVQGLPQETSEH